MAPTKRITDASAYAKLAPLFNHRILSKEEETALAQQVQAGIHIPTKEALKARNILVTHNMRLARKLCDKFAPATLAPGAAISLAAEGLVIAANKFEPKRGTRFGTVAGQWVRQILLRNGRDEIELIRLPTHVREKISKTTKLQDKLKRPLTDAEIRKTTGQMDAQKARDTLIIAKRTEWPDSLDRPVGDGLSTLGELISVELPPLEPRETNKALVAALQQSIQGLSPTERAAATGYIAGLGFDDVAAATTHTESGLRDGLNRARRKLRRDENLRRAYEQSLAS